MIEVPTERELGRKYAENVISPLQLRMLIDTGV